MNSKDLIDCAEYVCTGIIIALIDAEKQLPTVESVRDNWNAHAYSSLSDERIAQLIRSQARYV